MKCTNCNKEINDGAKFCKFCGVKLDAAHVLDKGDMNNDGVETHKNYITWHVLPGQLALKIDEREIESYKTIQGVYITPGTKALFFVGGKLVATLDSGIYSFKNLGKETNINNTERTPEKRSGVLAFFRNIANHIVNGAYALLGGNRAVYTVVLVRGAEFPIVFDFNNIYTATLPVDIGLHIRCKITNINLFFENQLVDKKIVSIKSFADALNDHVNAIISRIVASIPCEDITYNNEHLVNTVFELIRTNVEEIYGYFTVTHVINFSSHQEDLSGIRELKNELYVAEKELEHLQQRYDYVNRLQSVENTQALHEARTRVDFEALVDEIDNQKLLNNDKKEQFVEMLEAQAELRRATTETEQQVALNKLKKTTLLNEEEIDHLQKEIKQRSNVADISNAHSLAMVIIRNKGDLEREKLLWEMEIGNKKFDYELSLQDKKLDHDIASDNKVFENRFERDNRVFEADVAHKRAAAEYSDERRQADINFEMQQMTNQMELLRQAQAIREEREQAQHARDMEVQKMQMDKDLESERLRANTEIEKDKVYATMTFEQIMAANPDISPEAAAALAKKFEAEIAAAQSEKFAEQNDKTIDIMRQHDEDIKAILAQQMNMARDIVNAQAMASSATLESKQQELNRIHRDTQRNEDRYVDVVRSTLSAASGVKMSAQNNQNNGKEEDNNEQTMICPVCRKKHLPNTMFCDECGATLK